ncbi:MAG TPA: NRDE family protein [Chryseosolibacter sp.]|nr:NRDE family protein [Chryseosolibacter sp.]
MCLIFLALKQHPTYKFILAANRDEFYKRKTAPAAFWEDEPAIVGGRDLEAGGTWLGMNTNGRISMVTNYRDLRNIKPVAPSRGHLVSDFLSTTKNAETYAAEIEPRAKEYNGFNLLVGDAERLLYISNYRDKVEKLTDGIYGLSNHLLDTPWPKVKNGKEIFSKLISEEVLHSEMFFQFLTNEDRASDELLPDTGIGLERERALSAMFIKSPGYGSRCSTVILVDQDNNVTFSERVYDLETFAPTTSTFTFTIRD